MKLHAVVSGEGEGPPVVFLHGLFGRAANFGVAQRRLSKRFRVIALDLRNHGTSPHAPEFTYADLAADVIETLRDLDALPAIIVGHSMGGKTAMVMALTAPETVARLVVVDIAPVTYTPHHRGYVDAMVGLKLVPGMTRAEADAILAPAMPDVRERGFLLQNFIPGATPRWQFGLAEIDAGLAGLGSWSDFGNTQYPGPTLFIAGGKSDYILPDYRPAIRALFPASRVLTLKQASHWVHADDAEGFLAALEAFLG